MWQILPLENGSNVCCILATLLLTIQLRTNVRCVSASVHQKAV